MTKFILPMVFLPTLLLMASGAGGAATQKSGDDPKVKELFATTCGWCHQNGGREAGKGPKLAGTTRSDDFIVHRIKEGKEGAMPAFEGALTNAQIKSIVRYIRNLKEN
jgi:mono/diheme cytochrome c family protein